MAREESMRAHQSMLCQEMVCYIRIDHEANVWTDKDTVQLKTRKALTLQAEFIEDFLNMIEYIENSKLSDDSYELRHYLFFRRIVRDRAIRLIHHEMDERFYEHHGRVTEKHVLVEEQDDIIRILRRKIVHQRNSMAEEKTLIKDLKFAEETRANIISANRIEKTWCFPEDMKKRIKDFKAKILHQRVELKEMKAEFEGLDKDILESCMKQLMKMDEMKKEVEKFISFLSVVVRRNA